MLKILLVVGLAGILTSSIFAGMCAIATIGYLVGRRRRSRSAPIDFAPPVSLLKPLHGTLPNLEEYLEGYFQQDYPNYEILFCARHSEDAGLAVARKVAARHPEIPTQILCSGEPPWLNARCYSLSLMTEAAQHDILVMTDADIPVQSDYLRSMVAPFRDSRIGLITCVYRGQPIGGGLGERLEALGMSVEMTAGVLVARMMEGIRFTLGPSTAIRRKALDAIGGFQALRSYAADDYMLGCLAANSGIGVVLSDYVINHSVYKCGFRKCIEHELSWKRSTRFSRPKGHLGTGLTFAVPYGILVFVVALLLGHPWVAVLGLGWTVVSRILLSVLVGGFVVRDPRAVWLSFLNPVRDLLGFVLWVSSYASSSIRWHGRVFNLLPGGILQKPDGAGRHGGHGL